MARHPGAMRRQRPLRLLHHLAVPLALSARPLPPADRPLAAGLRRRRQRLALAQRLLDPLPAPLRAPFTGDGPFWQALRWGAPALLLGWWLGR
ncbi:MAG: hypothetical protein VKN13_00175 [Cyanobacteriota bacterium]|nr:hypothetical protein [Cyanobacteriota bacterium]